MQMWCPELAVGGGSVPLCDKRQPPGGLGRAGGIFLLKVATDKTH